MSNQEATVLVPAEERKGTPKELFFIWFASNIGIMGVVYGAIIVGYNLSFLQSLLAAAVGAISFGLVGYLSLSGRDTGATTFILSRAAFGFKGNYIPTFMGWLNLVGWLAVNVATGTLTILALLNLLGINQNTVSTIIALLIFAGLIILSSIFGQDSLVKIQTFFTYVFGGLTLLILAILIPKTNWSELFNMANGSWISGFLPAVSIIIAGTGISWSIAAADYSCYQKPNQSSRSVISSVTFGAFIPLFVIMSVGVLMSTSVPDLASAANPIEAISHALPNWVTILYFVTAIGGLIPQCIISLKSARVNLETLNIRVSNKTSIIIHAVIMILIPIYTLFISQDFMGNFQMFLGLLGIGMAAWAAVFLVDYVKIRRKKGYDIKLLTNEKANGFNYNGVISWLTGAVVGYLFTNSPFFNGPFAKGIFQDNSLGVLLAFAVSAVLHIILLSVNSKKE